jgi:hypothetical protein
MGYLMLDIHLHECDPLETKKALEALASLDNNPAFNFLVKDFLMGTYREVILEGMAYPTRMASAEEKEIIVLKLSAIAQLKSFLKELRNFEEVLTMLEDSNI